MHGGALTRLLAFAGCYRPHLEVPERPVVRGHALHGPRLRRANLQLAICPAAPPTEDLDIPNGTLFLTTDATCDIVTPGAD